MESFSCSFGVERIDEIFTKMQTENTLIDDLKYQYRHGGMVIRLLLLNLAVFLFVQIVFVFARLIGGDTAAFMYTSLDTLFYLKTNVLDFLIQPWGLITSIFAHFSVFHFLFNMIFLYFVGRMFVQFFDQKRLLYTYILGGLGGGLLEILAHLIFPTLRNETQVVVGASGSIMAIFAALAFYRPNLTVKLFGLFPIRLIFLAGIFILSDLISLGLNDKTAHFAHIGGVIVGLLSIKNLHSKTNIVTGFQRFIESISGFFSGLFKPKSKLTVKRGGASNARFKTDEEFIVEAKLRQQKIDAILDKISKSGYESLTKAEKDFLFQQSKNG